jgi:excisionase family DNA binding protein
MSDLQTTLRGEPKSRPTRRKEPERLAVPVDDACKITGLSRSSVYQLLADGKLQSVLIRRRRLVLYSSIEALLQPQAA